MCLVVNDLCTLQDQGCMCLVVNDLCTLLGQVCVFGGQ